MVGSDKSPSSGFTLLEILLSTVVLGIILIAVAMMARSCTNMTKALETNRRIEKIKTYYIDYYKENEAMFEEEEQAVADGVQVQETRVAAFPKDMHRYLEGKLRMDGWGEFFRYYHLKKWSYSSPGTDQYWITDIAGLLVDGTIAAGVLISYGPNHLRDYTIETNTQQSFPDRPWLESLQTRGDDLLYPIVVVEEAINIAKTELYCVLRESLNQYDSRFRGVNNDSDTRPDPNNPGSTLPRVDENGCVPFTRGAGVLFCPNPGNVICGTLPNDCNDPNCGWATLNSLIFPPPTYTCPPLQMFPLGFIIASYGLDDKKYRFDPWGREYLWEYSLPNNIHRFYSGGPNQVPGVIDGVIDDVTPQLPEGGCP